MERFILENKLSPPNCERMMVRERLLDAVIGNGDAKLYCINADAGYGKTVLLAQLFDRLPEPHVWYRLNSNDDDAASMLLHLSAGVSKQVPYPTTCCSNLIEDALTGGLDAAAMLPAFIAEFQDNINAPFNFFLDDFQVINSSAASLSVIQQLIDYLPDNVHFYIGTRQRPELSLSRLRAGNDLVEIGVEELRFTADETERLFSGRTPRAADKVTLAGMLERTEGWPAALSLVKNQLNHMVAGGADTFAPAVFRDIREYLAEEIWPHLDDDLKLFLMHNALLEVMDPELCSTVYVGEKLTVAEAGQLLETATESNILVYRLGERDEYRAHSLFREFLKGELRKELNPGEVNVLHCDYAAYFEAKDQVAPAADHYIEAGMTDELAQLIETHGETVLNSGQIQTLSRWLDYVSEDIIEQRPWLSYFKARVTERDKNIGEVTRLLSVAQRGFVSSGDRHGLYLFTVGINEVLFQGNKHEEAMAAARSALEYADNAVEKIFLLNRIALSCLITGQPDEAMELLNQASEICGEAGGLARLQIDLSLVSTKFFMGDFRGILEISERLLDNIVPGTPAHRLFVIISFRVRALFETCQYAEANTLLQRSWMLLGEEFRSREQFLDILQALVDLYTGHAREGRRAIEEIVREHDSLQLLGPDIPLVYIGNLDRQKRAFHKALLRHEAALELFEGREVYTQASCLVSLGADKMRIDGGVSDAGLEELDATEAMAKKARADFVLAQVSFHRAWWALKQGDEKQALAAIEDSLGKAARNGYDHFIFREGRISLDLLALAFKNGIERDYLVEIFGRIGSVSLSPLAPLLQSEDPLTREATIRALSLAGGLSAVPRIQRMLRDSDDRVKMTARAELGSIREDIATPREMLSRREYEVLGIVAEGATNSEIAVRLVITETTVKSHVSSIFRKLNVSTRVQAVMYYEQPENSESDTGEDN